MRSGRQFFVSPYNVFGSRNAAQRPVRGSKTVVPASNTREYGHDRGLLSPNPVSLRAGNAGFFRVCDSTIHRGGECCGRVRCHIGVSAEHFGATRIQQYYQSLEQVPLGFLRAICATPPQKRPEQHRFKAVLCCLITTVGQWSSKRRRGASRGRPVWEFRLSRSRSAGVSESARRPGG